MLVLSQYEPSFKLSLRNPFLTTTNSCKINTKYPFGYFDTSRCKPDAMQKGGTKIRSALFRFCVKQQLSLGYRRNGLFWRRSVYRSRGFLVGRWALAFTSLYPVHKSNGHISGQTALDSCLNLWSAMPNRNFSQTGFFLNFGHKGRTSRLDIRMEKDATPLRKIAHSGPHGDDFFWRLFAVMLNTANSLFTDSLRHKKSFYGIFQKYTVW